MKKLSSVQWSQLWEKYSKYSFLQSCFETEFKYVSQKKYITPFYVIFSPLALWAIASTQILKLIIWIPLFLGHFVDSILSTRIYTISRFSVPQEICSHIFIILGLHFTTLYSVLLCVEVIALSPYLQNLFLHIPIPCPKYESISNISCKMCVCTKIIIQRKFISCVESFLSDPSIMYFKQYGGAVLPHVDGLLKPRSFFLIILIIIKRSFSAGSAGSAFIWPLELSLH